MHKLLFRSGFTALALTVAFSLTGRAQDDKKAADTQKLQDEMQQYKDTLQKTQDNLQRAQNNVRKQQAESEDRMNSSQLRLLRTQTDVSRDMERKMKAEAMQDAKRNQRVIVIRRTGDKDAKLNVEIRKGKVFINGKPAEKFDNGNISIEVVNDDFAEMTEPTEPMPPEESIGPMPPMPPMPPMYSPDASVFRNDRRAKIARDDEYNAYGNSAFLGVACKESEKNGATVLEVTPGSAAEKAGILKGDVITRINDEPIANPKRLTEVVRGYHPDQKVTVTLMRGGKEQKVTATLKGMKGNNYSYNYDYNLGNLGNLDRTIPDMMNRSFSLAFDGPKIGLEVQDAEDGKGVTVLKVDDSSASQKAGILKGDQITALDGDAVEDAGDLARKINEARNKHSVNASVLRNGTSKDIEIKIPRKLKKADL